MDRHAHFCEVIFQNRVKVVIYFMARDIGKKQQFQNLVM